MSSTRCCTFFYNVTGEEAERLLNKYGKDGEFLARPSESQPSSYTLSIKRGTGVTHVKVSYDRGRFLGMPGGDTFDSLPALVQHYVENSEQLQETNGSIIVLKRPVTIPISEPAAHEARAPTAESWLHVNLTGPEAEHLLAKEKDWTFLVRYSQRAPGSYVITVKTKSSTKHILIEKDAQTGMYHVGGGDEFPSVRELLAHYNFSAMVEQKTLNVVHLITLIPSTCVPADAISERIRLLYEYDPHAKRNGFAEEFDRIQKDDDQLLSCRIGKKEEYTTKNRYKNIIPFDQTRVVLEVEAIPKEPTDSDYINASYIRFPKNGRLRLDNVREYISAQGCLDNTVVDFWRMIWQENSRVIVMTTRENELGKSKCYRYWPDLGEERCYRGFYCKTIEELSYKTREKNEESFVKRVFRFHKEGSAPRIVHHLQYVGWPDHDKPESPEPVLEFLAEVDRVHNSIMEPQGPILVHCSAGIGRSGTFIMIDVLSNQIRKLGLTCPIDIPATLTILRRQRKSMIQTVEQYTFVYKAVDLYVSKILKYQLGESYDEKEEEVVPPPPPVPRRQKAYVSASHDA
ncbi:unnamed protein product [Auanema sp. JU1783]|nr:unnamed protein product [Auanema sp. JU1783]